MEHEQPRVELKRSACPYCKDPVRPGDAKAACNACMAWHHQDCWTEHGGCSACGGGQGVHDPQRPRDEDLCAEPRCDDRAEVAVKPWAPVRGTETLSYCRGHAPFVLRDRRSTALVMSVLFFLIGIALTGGVLMALAQARNLEPRVVGLFVGLLLVFAAPGPLLLWRARRFHRRLGELEEQAAASDPANEEQLDGKPGPHGAEQP